MPATTERRSLFKRGSPFRRAIRGFLPASALHAINHLRFAFYRRRFENLDRRELFSRIYKDRLFGSGHAEPFYSGDGSRGRFAEQYCELVSGLIRQEHIRSVVDLGCGDFCIGKRLAPLVDSYVGVDIVPELIEHHEATHASARVRFECLDIVEDSLPAGELCLIRQVFQHLNNAEISRVLEKVKSYRYVLVTENVPTGEIRFPNVDHVHGPETRLIDNSGVVLTEPPFSQDAAAIWRHPYDKTSILLTLLLAPRSQP
jgi:SAM-dependent methyltransferase